MATMFRRKHHVFAEALKPLHVIKQKPKNEFDKCVYNDMQHIYLVKRMQMCPLKVMFKLNERIAKIPQ